MLCCHYLTLCHTKCICRCVWLSAVPVCHSSIRTLLLYSCIYSWLYLYTWGWNISALFIHLGCILDPCFAVCCFYCCCGYTGEAEYRLAVWAIAWPWLCCIMCQLCCSSTGLQAGWHTVRPLWSCALLAFCNRLSDWCCAIQLLIESGWKSATVLLSC